MWPAGQSGPAGLGLSACLLKFYGLYCQCLACCWPTLSFSYDLIFNDYTWKVGMVKNVPILSLPAAESPSFPASFEMLASVLLLITIYTAKRRHFELMKQECDRSLPHPWMPGRPYAEHAFWPGTQTCAPSAP